MIKKLSYTLVSSVVLVLALAAVGFSQTSPGSFPNIKISNFGQMDEHFYRGAQPKKDDYAALKALGVHTVIDLVTSPKSYERPTVQSLGMKYVNIPIEDGAYPTPDTIATFLKTIDEPDTGVFFVHCIGGRHRTGDMGALYRFTKYGWGFDKVYQEMENYDFYTAHGHQKAKDFVVDYATKMEAQKTQKMAAPAVKLAAPMEQSAVPVEKSAASSVASTTPVAQSAAPVQMPAESLTKATAPTWKEWARASSPTRWISTSLSKAKTWRAPPSSTFTATSPIQVG